MIVQGHHQKHPHGRGEDPGHHDNLDPVPETPPRAWGRLLVGLADRQVQGNTPTGVGKTVGDQRRTGATWKHPHGRGEDFLSTTRTTGSPRNTPTGVGKTGELTINVSVVWKHPHGRGEDSLVGGRLKLDLETPPRAWGRPLKLLSQSLVSGNTPTGVGKTSSFHLVDKRLQKHPHGRGEDCSAKRACNFSTETPPRAWGRPTGQAEAVPRTRNTPTGVGKTA